MLAYQRRKRRFESRANRSNEYVSQFRESLTPKLIQEFLPLRLHNATTAVPPPSSSLRPSSVRWTQSPLPSYSPRPASGRGVGGEGDIRLQSPTQFNASKRTVNDNSDPTKEKIQRVNIKLTNWESQEFVSPFTTFKPQPQSGELS